MKHPISQFLLKRVPISFMHLSGGSTWEHFCTFTSPPGSGFDGKLKTLLKRRRVTR